jgi:hypothetical protein
MSSARLLSALAAASAILALSAPSSAADLSCEGLVPSGQRMICAGFEPNWALTLSCSGMTMSSTFIDAFSGDLTETPGTVAFSSQNPWVLSTSHGIEGTIAYTPAGCTDEGDFTHDFTFTPTAAPGLDGDLLMPFCCRME